MSGTEALHARHVTVRFDGVLAVDGVDLALERGEILGLIGPNGAGKTTLVNVLSGYQWPTAGEVQLDGAPITRWTPQRRARHGLTRTFQSVRLFRALDVRENVEVGALSVGASARESRRRATDVLRRLDLALHQHRIAASLPLGDERRLGIARALATRPRFLLLDEPAAGLNERESEELLRALAAIRDDFGCALMVIEHDMRLIMRLCERLHVLDSGRTLSLGTPDHVRRDPAVLAAYLGTRKDPEHAGR